MFISDAVTSELGDRQSSHPVKNPASIFWQVFTGVARCCLPRFQGQLQHLKYQNGINKKIYAIYENDDKYVMDRLRQHVEQRN